MNEVWRNINTELNKLQNKVLTLVCNKVLGNGIISKVNNIGDNIFRTQEQLSTDLFNFESGRY